jgi:hypothetical protein
MYLPDLCRYVYLGDFVGKPYDYIICIYVPFLMGSLQFVEIVWLGKFKMGIVERSMHWINNGGETPSRIRA